MAVGDTAREMLFKLLIKGVEPGEAARASNSTLSELETNLQASMARQVQAHKIALETTDALYRRSAEKQLREVTKETQLIVGQIQAIEKAQQKAAKETSASWSVAMNDAKNFTVVAAGVATAVQGVYQSFKATGEEIVRTTEIYNSLKISIADAAEATDGTVANIDLIAASNRALEKDLKLTGEQFGAVAARADKYADSIGVSGKQALDSLIDALATARLKALEHAGVIIDEQKEYAKLSREIHVTVENLTAEEKKLAVVNAALEQMTDHSSLDALFEKPATFSQAMEKSWTTIGNVVSGVLANIGNMEVPEFLTSGTSGYSEKQLQDLVRAGLMTEDGMAAELRKRQKAQAERDNALARQEAQARGEFIEGGSYRGIVGRGHEQFYEYGTDEKAPTVNTQLSIVDKAIRKVMLERAELLDQLRDQAMDMAALMSDPFGYVDRKEGTEGGLDRFRDARSSGAFDGGVALIEVLRAIGDEIDVLEPKLQDLHELLPGHEGPQFLPINTVSGMSSKPDAEINRFSQTQNAELDFQKRKQQDRDLARMGYGPESAAPTTTIDELERQQKLLDEVFVQAGGTIEMISGIEVRTVGVFEQLLFGPDGPQTIFDNMTAVEQQTLRFSQELSTQFKALGKSLAGAVGQSVAMAIGESKSLKDALKDTFHATMMTLSAEAASRVLVNLAKAAEAGANPLTAALVPGYLAAAGAWSAVTVAAGIGARATYSAPGSTAGIGSAAPSSRPSVGAPATTGGGGSVSNYWFVNAPLGTKAEVEAALADILVNYRLQHGHELGAKV